MTKKIIFTLISIIILLIGILIYTYTQNANQSPTFTACTLEGKVCPDGSVVGRAGPNCEFAECPPSAETIEDDPDEVPTHQNTESVDNNQFRSTLEISEKNNYEEIVCPDDVKICPGGGHGTPPFETSVRRMPPNCTFPSCPG